MSPDPAPLVELALSRPPTLRSTRLVCIDGPAGSGKTTLADLLVADCLRRGLSTSLVHMDDVYEGWGGLAGAGEKIRTAVVEPLGRGEAAGYHRYDWHLEDYAELVPVAPADLLVVEGVGSGHLGYADRITVLAFVEAPQATRFRRGLERDGAALEPQWRRWALEEERLHEEEQTRSRADVLVDGVTGRLSRPGARSPRAR